MLQLVVAEQAEKRARAGIFAALPLGVRFRLAIFLLMVAALAHVRTEPPAGAEIPFAYREGLLWVEVRMAQSGEPLHFLLDSGAEVSVLNLSAARRLGLALGPTVKVQGVQATLEGHWPQALPVAANGVRLPSRYLVVNLAPLSRSCTQPVDGLIGADFFRGRVVELDFASRRVRLLNSPGIPESGNSVPLAIRRCGMRVQASINDCKPQWFRVDTGCASALQWVTREVGAEACGGKVAVGLAELSIPQANVSLRLGRGVFQGVPAGLHREAIFPGEAGLLGNALLSRFKTVTLDGVSGRLSFGELRRLE